jgi:threonine dehydrogenase-like Zn-dependent dehydrogenase
VSSHSLLGHLGYQKRHLDELVTLVSSGRLDISGSVSGTLALDDIAEGVERLASKRGDPIRLVVLP